MPKHKFDPPTYEESQHFQQQQQRQYSTQPQERDGNFRPNTVPTPLMDEEGTPGPRMPPIIPAYSSTNTLSSELSEHITEGIRENVETQQAFIRKVYIILAAQLFITTSIVAVFTFVDPVRLFVIQNPAVYWVAFALFFIMYLFLICCEKASRKSPLNLILLFIFTLIMSCFAGTLSSYYETKALLLELGLVALLCILVAVFSFQDEDNPSSFIGFFCALCLFAMTLIFITALLLFFNCVAWLDILYATVGVVIFCYMLMHNTHSLTEDRDQNLIQQEYVYSVIFMYTNITEFCLFALLAICDNH